jgi:hypothetical protein
LANNNVIALAVLGETLFAGTGGGGVFRSQDNGDSWTAVNDGLRCIAITAITVSGKYLFAGIYTYGVWRRPLYEMVNGVTHREPQAQHPAFFQVRGNTLEYSLSTACCVSLMIYDLKGRLCGSIITKKQSEGFHVAPFLEKSLPQGAYIADFKAGKMMIRKQVIIGH